MHDCDCCGIPVYGLGDELCTGCYNGCDPATTWHCFTGNCDGSGCTYPGECEAQETPTDRTLLDFAKTAVRAIPCDGCHATVGTCTCGQDDRDYWSSKYE